MTHSSFQVPSTWARFALAAWSGALLASPSAAALGGDGVPLDATQPEAPVASPVGPTRLAHLLPEDVFAYVEFSGLSQSAQLAQGLELMELWHEPEVQDFVGDLVEEVRYTIQRAPAQEREMAAMFRDLLSGRIALAVGELHLIWADGQPMPVPGAVAALELRPGQGDQVRGLIQQALGSVGNEIVTSKHLLAGKEITYVHPRDDNFSATMGYCLTDDLLLVGFEEELLEACVRQLDTPGAQGTLAASAALRQSQAHAQGQPVIESFFNVAAFKSRLGGLIPVEVRNAIETLGLDAIEGIYFASTIEDGAGRDTLAVHAPGPRTGLLACGGDSPFSAETFALVPEEAVMVSAMRFDSRQAFEVVLAAVSEVVPPVAMQEIDGQLAMAERELGFDPLEDLLHTLGTELVAFVELPRNGLIPSATVSLSLKDAQRFSNTLSRLLARAPVERTTYRDYQLTVVSVPEVPIAPTFTVTDERLILSLTPGALKRTLAGMGSGQSPAFAQGHAWREEVAYFSYLDLPRLAAFAHNFAENLLPAAIDESGLPLDAFRFPSLEAFTNHLDPLTEIGYETESGWVVQDDPLGLAAWLALAAYGIESLPLAGSSASRDEGNPPLGLVRSATAENVVAAEAPRPTPDGVVNPVEAGSRDELRLLSTLRALEQNLEEQPDNGGLHFSRAVVLGQVREYDKALESYAAALEHGFQPVGTLHYNRACTYSLLGQTDASLKALGQAFDNGFDNLEFVQLDSDLDHVRQDARFSSLVSKQQSAQ